MTEPTQVTPPVRSRRAGRLAAIVLLITVLLCGGGATTAFLLVRKAEPHGTVEPAAAVDGFFTAVFTKKSARDAAEFVCPRARDLKELEQLIDNVSAFERQFSSPHTSWRYPPVQATDGQASATVRLTLTTANFQIATKDIRVLLVDDRGWWICDIETVS